MQPAENLRYVLFLRDASDGDRCGRAICTDAQFWQVVRVMTPFSHNALISVAFDW
jgi:hypothetical protein